MTSASTLPRRTTAARSHEWLLYGVVAVILAGLWALVAWLAFLQKQQLMADGQHELDWMRQAVVRHMEGVLRAAETDLHVVDHWLQAHPTRTPEQDPRMLALLDDLQRSSDGLIDVQWMHTEDPAAAALPAQPRTVAVGTPHQGKLPVSWRLEQPMATLAGLQARIDLERLVAYHEQFLAGPSGTILLLRDDGILLSRAPAALLQLGQDLHGEAAFKAMQRQSEGAIELDSHLTDGVPRLGSFGHLEHFGLRILVTRTQTDVLSVYALGQKIRLLSAGVFTLLLLAMAWRLNTTLRRLRQEKAAHALAAAELTAAHNATPLGLFRCDTNGHLAYVNEEWRKIMHLPTPQDPDLWLERVLPSVREQVRAQWRANLPQDLPTESHCPFDFGNGTVRLLYTRTRAIRVRGQVVGHVGSVEDVTERSANQKAQRMLTAILELSNDVVVQTNPDGRLHYLNPAARRTLGLPADAPLDSIDARNFLPPWVLEKREQEIIPHALAHGVWIGETALYNAQHQEVPMSHMFIVHRDQHGEVERFSAILRDISAAKAAQRSLQQSERFLRSIADCLPMRVAYIDLQERFQFVNETYAVAQDSTSEAICGRTVREVIGEFLYSVVRDAIARALQGETVHVEREFTNHRGYQWHRATYVPQFDADGVRTVGALSIVSDVTQQKLEERRLVELSHRDTLTGLSNRAGFYQKLALAMAHVQANGGLMAVLYLDIDHFKPVNDTHGHLAGDLLLQGFAGRLAKTLRTDDHLARLGGDEFAVILENLEHDSDAATVAKNIVQAMHPPFMLENHQATITTSVGAALYRGQAGVTEKDLVRLADEMLYEAKAAGRDGMRMRAWPAPAATDPAAGTPESPLHTHQFAEGKFQPHGQLQVWAGGEIITQHASGPFNRESVEAINRARLEMLARNAHLRRHVYLTHCSGSVLITPDALEVFGQGLQEAARRYQAPLACAWVRHGEVEGYDLLAPKYEAAHRTVGTQMRLFDREEDAQAWLRQVLQEHAGDAR